MQGADEVFLTIKVTADAFLYRMVRNIVSTLVDVGKGRIQPGTILATIYLYVIIVESM